MNPNMMMNMNPNMMNMDPNMMNMGPNMMMNMNPNMMNMNPMMMNMNMDPNMMNMNPMMMNMNMNPMMMNMNMNPMMMNMNMNNIGNANIGDNEGWNLIFEQKKEKKNIIVTISPDKTVKEAISIFKIKSGQPNEATFKFIFNGKQLAMDLKVSESGLANNSVITVISLQNLVGA